MAGPTVVHSVVEPLGAVRLVPTADPVDMEYVAEVLRIDDCVVDLETQAVFRRGQDTAVRTSWLHAWEQDLPTPDLPGSYLPRGVLPALGGGVNVFYLLMEVAAGLHVAASAGSLDGADVVGWRPVGADPRLDEVLALYGCHVRPRPTRGGRLVRVAELAVPRFWIREAGSATSHEDAPRWAAAGYSRTFLRDLRSRLLPLPPPPGDRLAFDPGPARDRSGAMDVVALRDAGALVVPDLTTVALAAGARFYADVRGLVAMHGESNVNVVFLPDDARVEEVFPDDEAPGQFGLLAGLRGLAYEASVGGGSVPRVPEMPALLSRVGAPSLAAGPPTYLLTGVWDNADLLEDWLAHHRAMGFAGVLAMDFGSTDGSVEILGASRWEGFVETVPFPGITADHTAVLVEVARRRWPDGWGLLIDPDEFLVTATGDLTDPVLGGAVAAGDVVTLPRFHMTATRSTALASDQGPSIADLGLRLVAQDQGKVMLSLSSGAEASLSAHEGSGGSHIVLTGISTCLLHAPVRSYGPFAQKVAHAASTLAANSHLDAGFAWHWRRWIAIAEDGGLDDEHVRQFLDDEELAALLDDGVYVHDDRLIDLARAARAQRVETS